MLKGIQTGHISQEKKIKAIAAHQIIVGSELLTPIQT
jgi:hypothetical protein